MRPADDCRIAVSRNHIGWYSLAFAITQLLTWGCAGKVPSQVMTREVQLPVPAASDVVPDRARLTRKPDGDKYVLTPRSLISVAFDLQPDIKSSYQRFKSEEARYDFFYTSRDALTPQLSFTNTAGEARAEAEDVVRTRSHAVELGIEKRFFDTTELDVSLGYLTDEEGDDIGNRPFVAAALRYPLWVSRQKLARTSEDIFRRNELNDAQLNYIQTVRNRLQNVLFRFHEVVNLRHQVDIQTRWAADLERLLERVNAIDGRDVTADRQRVEAEIASVSSNARNVGGRFQIDLARLKAAAGIPFHAEVDLVDDPFNPFTRGTHEQWLLLSIETDPELATLRNEVVNSEVQLDLARRGRWDLALLLDGQSTLEGRGRSEGDSNWSVSAGVAISHVDSRVTDSLARQAQARINRFRQAIVARENAIYTDTLEPLVRIDTLGESRDQLIETLPKYVRDYETGIEEYLRGNLNIDDLLKRRENIASQELEISRLLFLVGANVAELCAATGKFFDLLEEDGNAVR